MEQIYTVCIYFGHDLYIPWDAMDIYCGSPAYILWESSLGTKYIYCGSLDYILWVNYLGTRYIYCGGRDYIPCRSSLDDICTVIRINN